MSTTIKVKRLLALFIAALLLSACSSSASDPRPGRFSLRIGGGWSAFSMSDLNDDYIDGFIAETFHGDMWLDHFNEGPHFLGEVDYALSSRISLGLGVNYLYTKSEGGTEPSGTEYYIDDTDRAVFLVEGTYTYTATLIAPEIKGFYHLPPFFGDPYLGSGVAWCFGKTKIEVDSWAGSVENELSANGLGVEVFGGTTFDITTVLSFGVELGYRYFSTGKLARDYESEDDSVLENMKLEFTGPYAGLVARINL